ncbi:MAG: zinc-binding dehydrogenase [Nitrospinota bacterium]|nr:zinc-binding dehydrogenase [Nitrospinota bacterium]
MVHSKAAVLLNTGKPLKVFNLQVPALKNGQVLVETAYSGLCHTQLLEIRGKRGIDHFLPHTLGHEGSGRVVKIGQGVKKVKPGDHVVLTWIKASGMDVQSTQYGSAIGEINSGAISTFMDKTVVSENRLIKIPKKMPLREAALLGCAVPTGAGIVRNTASLKANNSIAIFGLGGIGMSVVLASKMMGAKVIIGIDVEQNKLERAKEIGATNIVNAKKVKVIEEIQKITNNQGVDFSVEAIGNPKTMEDAFSAVRINGGLCILAGNLPFGEKISIDPFDLIKGKNIVGTWGGETSPERDIRFYIKKFFSGEMGLSDLITHEYDLEHINEGFSDLEKGKVGRALIKMGK